MSLTMPDDANMLKCPTCENQIPLFSVFKAPFYLGRTCNGDLVSFCSTCKKWYRWTLISSVVFLLSLFGLTSVAAILIVGFGVWGAPQIGIDPENNLFGLSVFFILLIFVFLFIKLLSRLVKLVPV